MAKWDAENIVLTSRGEEILAKVASGVGSITVSRVVSGKTSVSLSQLTRLTAIPSIAQEFSIQSYSTNDNGSSLEVQVSNTGLQAEYELWQIGVYVLHQDYSGEQLYYVAQATSPDVIPLPSDTPLTMNYSLFLQHSGVSNVVITTDLSGLVRREEHDTLKGDFDSHKEDKENPHGVTKSQIGLGNVPNVSTNNQTPTYTEASSNAELVSGESLSTAFGKLAKIVKSVMAIISGAQAVGNATKLNGKNASDYAMASTVTNITNGTTSIGLAKGHDIVSAQASQTIASLCTSAPSGQYRAYRYAMQLPSDFPNSYVAGNVSLSSTRVTVVNYSTIAFVTIEGNYSKLSGGIGSPMIYTPFLIMGTYDITNTIFHWRNISDGTVPASTNVVNATLE